MYVFLRVNKEITRILPLHLLFIHTSNFRKIRHDTSRQALFQGNYRLLLDQGTVYLLQYSVASTLLIKIPIKFEGGNTRTGEIIF